MKRKISLLLALILCFTLISSVAKESSHEVLVTYDQVYDLVLENNKTIKSNNLALEVMKNPPGVTFARDALWNASQGLSSSINMVQSAIISAENENIALALTLGLSNLQATKAELSAQMEQLNSPSDEDMDKNKKQFKQIEQQLIWGSQSMYMAYLNLSLQIDDMKVNLNSVSNTIKSLEKRFELGQVSQLDVENAKIGVTTLESAIKSMEVEQTKLLMDINTMLGRDFDTSLSLSKEINPDLDYFNNIVFADDLKLALDNSFTYYNKQETLKDANDLNKNEDSDASQNNVDMATLNVEIEAEKIETALTKLFMSIPEKQRLLDVEKEILALKQKNVDAAKLKFEKGMISNLELDEVLNEYNAQNSKIITANFNLFTAIEQYKWALNGMITG